MALRAGATSGLGGLEVVLRGMVDWIYILVPPSLVGAVLFLF